MKNLVNVKLMSAVATFTVIASTLPRESAAYLALVVSPPVSHPVASPELPRNSYSWNQASGAWGESFVEQSLKLRGFQEVYEVKAPGGQGIDRIAVKRNPSGAMVDAKFVEVKTHRGGAARLEKTKVGTQMSRRWLADKYRAMRNSPDLTLRKLAKEINDFRKTKGVPIERLGELHDINTRTGQYTIRDPLKRVERSSTSLERQWRQIQRRSTSAAGRGLAAKSLTKLPQIRATSRNEWISGSGLPAGRSLAVRAHRRALLQSAQSASRTATMTAGAKPLQQFVRAAGPIGAATAVAVESYGIYSDFGSYQRGEISRRQLVAVSIQRGGGIAGAFAGAAVGAQTGAWIGSFGGPLVLITAPVGGVVGAGIGGVVGYFAGSEVAGAAAKAWYRTSTKTYSEVLTSGLLQRLMRVWRTVYE